MKKCLKDRQLSLWEFFEFMQSDPKFQQQYDQAQQIKAEGYVEELSEIADTEENPAKARNRLDARKWFASKIKPQKFGERIDINVNKTIDIRSAIAEGRARMIQTVSSLDTNHEEERPMRDLNNGQLSQVINITSTSADRSTGQEPVKRPESRDAKENSDDDIFS